MGHVTNHYKDLKMKKVVIELQFDDNLEIDDEIVYKELTTRIKCDALYWVEITDTEGELSDED